MSHIYSKEVSVKTIEHAKKLTHITTQYDEDIDLISGRYVTDAKSILSIFSLNLLQPITISIHTEDIDRANDLFKKLEEIGVK